MNMRTIVVWCTFVAVLAAGCGDDNKNPVAPSPVVEERTSLGVDGIDTSMQTASWGRPHVGEAGIDFGGRTSTPSTPSTQIAQIGEAGIDFGGRTSFSSTENGCTPDAGVVASLDTKLRHWPTVGRSDLVAVGNHAKTAFETQMTRYDFFAAVEADPNTSRNGVVKTSTWQGWSNSFWTSVLNEIDRLVECSLTPQNSPPSSVSISISADGETATCTATGGSGFRYVWNARYQNTATAHSCGGNGCTSNTISKSDASSLWSHFRYKTVQFSCYTYDGNSDNRRYSSAVDWYITGPNRAPVESNPLSINNVKIGEKRNIPLSSNFSDPDGDTLTYTTSHTPTNVLTPSIANGVLTITPIAAGTATLTVTATDPDGLSATTTASVTVRERRKPYFDRSARVEVIRSSGGTGNTVTLKVNGTTNWPAGGGGISCWRLREAGSNRHVPYSVINSLTQIAWKENVKGSAERCYVDTGRLGRGESFGNFLSTTRDLSGQLGFGNYMLHVLPCKVSSGGTCTEWEDRYPGWDYTELPRGFWVEPPPEPATPEPADSLPTSVWVERNGAGYVGYSYLRCRTKGGRGNFRYAWQAVEGNGLVNHTICDLNAPKGELRNGLSRCERDWTATTLGGALPANREYKFSCRAILDNSTYTDYSPGVPWTLKNPH